MRCQTGSGEEAKSTNIDDYFVTGLNALGNRPARNFQLGPGRTFKKLLIPILNSAVDDVECAHDGTFTKHN